MKIGVLLSGNGVYDGAEIHESVLTLYFLAKMGAQAICIAPDVAQHHVINHLTGEEMDQTRNVLVEAARIARGQIVAVSAVDFASLDALIIPGGFGVAKNFTKWAFEGPQGQILPEITQLIAAFALANKPIAALCMAPTTVAKALEGLSLETTLSVGSTNSPSPYDIDAISKGMQAVGAKTENVEVQNILVDTDHNIICSPCYMMEADIAQVALGIEKTVAKLIELATLRKEKVN